MKPLKILDRYIVTELGGPFLFGLAAFTAMFVAGELLNIARLVSEEHANLWAAAKYFLYSLPETLILTFPMSMLLAVLLAVSRLSGDFEITAMRAGGTSLYRIAAPIVAVGLVASFVALFFQEYVVPGATAKANEILQSEIQVGGADVISNQVVSTVLPNGELQATYAFGFNPQTEELINTTLTLYRGSQLVSVLTAPRAKYHGLSWEFFDAQGYALQPVCCKISYYPELDVDIGADPSQLVERTKQPEQMSRFELHQLLTSGVKQTDVSRYNLLLVTYESKLARPFSVVVFTILAIPLAIRPGRSSSGAGFGISIAIVFAFYVATTICLAIGRQAPQLALAMAWLPDIAFFAVGIWRLSEAARV